ncbi:hypothetical protein [Gordonia sp. NPDC003376]
MTVLPQAGSATRMTLTCYNDTHGWGWKHVDLFVHDRATGHELGWVHWGVPVDGPEAADRVTATVEPLLRRTSPWRHSRGPSGIESWEADAEWADEERG